MPAASQWRHKTRTPDEIWQCDATHYFVAGWGFYKQIAVQDDYSRYPLAWDVKPDELKKAVDEAITRYARTPHTALANVSPGDVYMGRKEEILVKRAEKKRLTLARRKAYTQRTPAGNMVNRHDSAQA